MAENDQPKGKKSKKIIILALGALVLLGGGAWLALFSPWHFIDGKGLIGMQSEKKEPEKEKPEARAHIYKMDPFIVNLNDPEKLRYLKIKMEFESSESKPNEEFEKRLPQLRDTILGVLSRKNSSEILDSGGKDKLRQEMKERLNAFLTAFQIQNIYFSEFVIQ